MYLTFIKLPCFYLILANTVITQFLDLNCLLSNQKFARCTKVNLAFEKFLAVQLLVFFQRHNFCNLFGTSVLVVI